MTSRPANEDALSPEQEALLRDPYRTPSPASSGCYDRSHRGYGGIMLDCLDCNAVLTEPAPGHGPDGPFADVSGGPETPQGRRLRTGTCEHGFSRGACERADHLEPQAAYDAYKARRLNERRDQRIMAVMHLNSPYGRGALAVQGPLAERLMELDALTTRKNEGYAGATPRDPWANYNSAEAWGLSGLDSVLMRFEEKRNRAATLYSGRGQDKVGESLRETLMDAAAIALIAVDMLDKQEDHLRP